MIGSEICAPDLIEPVIGYREWKVQDEFLISPHVEDPWFAGWMQARHRDGYMGRVADHEAPAQHCMCGLYGWFEVPPVTCNAVVGAVVMAGRLHVHHDGARAERAKVVALAPGSFATLDFHSRSRFPRYGLRLTRRGKREFRALCDRYEAECVWDPAGLPEVAERYGKPMPHDLRVPQAEAA